MQLELAPILEDLGITIVREVGDELVGLCPQHLARTGKEDHSPSWSINQNTYVHHCFSCGYAGTLMGLFLDLTGSVPENLEWELAKQSLTHTFDKPKEEVVEGPAVNEWVLSQYTDVPQRLLDRRWLKREAIDFFGVRWDAESKLWVLPIRSPEAELMGYQFRQRGVVINHPPDMKKSNTLFGAHLFGGERVMTLVESPLDAVRLWGLGIPCVSSMGAYFSNAQVQHLARNYRIVVAALDNDAAGWGATEKLLTFLGRAGTVCLQFDYTGLEGKDPGDVEDDEALINAYVSTLHLGAK